MTQMVRVAAALRLVDLFAAALPTVQVLDHTPTDAPGDTVLREWVGLADIEGDLELTHTKGGSGSTSYSDVFTVTFEVQVTTPQSASAALTRCGEILQAMVDEVRADPGLTDPTAIEGFGFMNLATIRGPRHVPLAEGTGYGARAIVEFSGNTHKLG